MSGERGVARALPLEVAGCRWASAKRAEELGRWSASGALSHFEENDFEARETSRFSNLQPGGPLRRGCAVGRGSNSELSSRWLPWKRRRHIVGPNSSKR